MIDWKTYLESICKKYAQWWDSYTITDVVGKNHNQQVAKSLLFDLQALTIKPEAIKPEKELLPQAEEERELLPQAKEEREILNVLEGLRKYAREHVLLIGRPGSGKSTALVRSLLESAQGFGDKEDKSVIASEAKRNEAISPTAGKTQIPVLVELRYYETSIFDLIIAFLHRHHPSLNIDTETIKTLLRQGQFLLLIDGVNELPSQEAQRNLQKFRQDYQQNTPMIFTTRDLGVGGDLGIEKKLEMQPLTETQMGEFVRGYLGETGEQMLQQLGGRLREFGETPLLLWMLCSVFASNGNQIPPNLGSVFRRFTEIYDRQIKQDIPVTDESRRWWKRLLQHLAWVMMTSSQTPHSVILSTEKRSKESQGRDSKTEFLVAIPRQQVEEIFTAYLEGKVNCAADCAIKWLDDLLKHHLIQIGAENKIEFRHQLIQEYYAAERFLQEVGKLSDDELQWDYLNYLKWTEPTALMLGFVDDEGLALRVVRLALQVDWQLGARLAGEVRVEWQEKTVGLFEDLNFPVFLRIRLFERSNSNVIIPRLVQLLEHQDSDVRISAANALGKIKSDAVIPELIQLLEHVDDSIRSSAANALGKIKSEAAITALIQLLKHADYSTRRSATDVLEKIQSETATPGLIQILDYADNYIRRSAADVLGKIKSETAVPGLIRLLEDADSSVRRSAANALGEIKSEAAVPGLIQLLGDTDSSVRISAANALGKIKSEAAVPGLIQLIEDANYSVRWITAKALGEIKSEAAVPGLIQLLKDTDLFVRSSAADALIKVKSDIAVHGLSKLLEDKSDYVRRSAVDVLIKFKSEIAIPGLIQLLKHVDDCVRRSAVDVLGEITSEEVIPRLIQLLKDKDNYIRRRAIDALGKIKSEVAIPELIQLLEDKDDYVRRRAIDALGKIKSEAAISVLIQLLEDKDDYVRRKAIDALGEIRLEVAIPELIQLLEDKDDYVRMRAIDALGEIRLEVATPELIQLLEDKDDYVRRRAIDALGKIKSEEAVPGLIKLLEDKDDYVRRRAIDALEKIKSEAAVPGLIKLLEHEDSDVRYRVIYVLKEIKPEAAVPGLIKLLEDKDDYVRWRAIDALEKIKSDVVIINLFKILTNQNFIKINNGDNAINALDALENIQQHLKYYKPKPKQNMSNTLSHNYALLIGVGECAYPNWSLPVSVKDIQAVKTLLTDEKLCGYIDNSQHLRLLSNETATSANILEGLNWLKQQAENDPKANIFIYYSGHGWLDKSTNKYYLIPHDTKPHKLTKTALPAENFNAALQQIPAKQLLVIIDSCHAQGMASSKDEPQESDLPDNFVESALPKNIIDELKQGTGKVVFTSSTGNQVSWIRPDDKMSVFTYHLLEALQGAANQPGDKVVKVSHLMNHLSKTVPTTARDLCKAEQTPFFDFATEDFAVALLCGGKGLATAGWDKQQAEETIRGISNQVNNGVGNVGDRNIGINIGTAGNITFGDLSSGS